MSFDTCKDVWVFIECFQGQPKSVGLELLGQHGRRRTRVLAQQRDQVVVQLVEGFGHRLTVVHAYRQNLSPDCQTT